MAPQTRSEVVVVGVARLDSGARAAARPAADLTPERWAIAPAKLARMDRLSALALVACDAALVDAGITALDPERTALSFGTAFGCHATNEDFQRSLVAGAPSPRLFASTLPSSPTGELSIHYRVHGAAITYASGGTAALDALDGALRLLRAGRADRVLVVAADVWTPWLERLTGGEERVDQAAALVLERAAPQVRPRGRLLACASAFAARDPARARVIAEERLGLSASARAAAEVAGGVRSLVAAARWLAAAPHREATALVEATDEAGAATIALLGAG